MITRLRVHLILRATAVLCSFACASVAPRSSEVEYRAVLATTIASIEAPASRPATTSSPRTVILVVSSDTPPALRRACIALRHTVYDYNLPELETYSLPPGFLEPHSLVVTGDTAVFKGLLGPVPAPGSPNGTSDCGYDHEVHLIRTPNGTWRSTGGRVTLCLMRSRPSAQGTA